MKRKYNFGFDPVTKEHKVICLWTQHDDDSNVFCEVLTVGQTIWRRIHEQVPYYDFMDSQSVYSSGCIYWSNVYLEEKEEILDVDEVLVVFDVGREKFSGFVLDLLEVDGRVAILRVMSSYIVKLCIFDDDHGYSNKNSTNTTTSSNKNWTEVTITLPFS
ncbi:putative F-box protein At1g46984 [Papaver somniferum]|uniref:putative F-box protein At1g46984 n=1 Tax=Papaver somniferum TaxID=3469 RepID=UPI000E703FFE|nr:putative F-box protein At1g46984 [Papaver somniferum]